MRVKFMKILVLLLLSNMGLVHAQEEPSVDVLLGESIQKYLEGDIQGTISSLNSVLENDPENERALNLMESSVERLTEEVKETGNYQQGMRYLQIAQRHIPDSPVLINSIREIQNLIDPDAFAPEPVSEPEPDPEPTPSRVAQREVRVYEDRIDNLSSTIAQLRREISRSADSQGELRSQLEELRREREELRIQLEQEIKEENGPGVFYILMAGALLLFGGVMGVKLFLSFSKKRDEELIKNIKEEKRLVENLKNTYNKDTQKLSEKLMQYGSSYKRAEELERNWKKVFDIMERLTRDGSTKKLVLPDGKGGRKAVTGIDTRTRARADSVEVIARIFKDSPRAPDMLKPFLDSKDNRTRANAAKEFYRYDAEKSIVVLQDMANSENKWMRLSAAWALGEIEETATSKVLEKLLDDPDEQVKNKARQALEKILGDKTLEEHLTEEDENNEKGNS